MKGIAKIQLLDADTGNVKYEKIDKNVVTTMINDLLNDLAEKTNYYGINGTLFRTSLIDNQIENIFGGILLLEETQALTNKFPKGKILGMGGQALAGVNVHDTSINGVFLDTESGPISGGYEFVWQWGVNEGNGTINAISLVDPSFNDHASIYLYNSAGTEGGIDADNGFPSYGCPAYFEHGTCKWYGIKNDKGFYIKDCLGKVGFGEKQSEAVFELVKANAVSEININHSLKEYDGYLYINQYDSGTDKISILKLDKVTGNIVDTITLDGTYTGANSIFGSFDLNGTYIAACTEYDAVLDEVQVSVFDMTGTLVGTVDVPNVAAINKQSIQFIEGTNEFFFLSTTGTRDPTALYCHAKVDAATQTIQLMVGGYSQTENYIGSMIYSKLTNKLVPINSCYSYSGAEQTQFVAPPLALYTINNLGTPIAKTNADILKITYTLLEA